MSKDPAFLFYTADFLTGIAFMNNEEVGKYIRTLCLLHQHGGRLSKEDIELVVGELSKRVIDKFQVDKKGLLFNQRLLDETNKRNAFCESRRYSIQQRYKKPTHVVHTNIRMENENRDINKDKDKDQELLFNNAWNDYPKRLGKKEAKRHYNATIKTPQDQELLLKAISNYKAYIKDQNITEQYIKNGSSFFNQWRDWIDYKPKGGDDKIPVCPIHPGIGLRKGEKCFKCELEKGE